ncbi:methionine ABC transporter ATP-binding protein [Ornithinicoccus hortensis]|uniref:D-methionine transport system ATP-binding protein n=1 Tax=Ornithinicoccus hortensis TaxID=82346 RepID=A0A542YQU5_9MICO|nr:ATP-binding cassette domain-containing protein [Ornithinicoccus hortensis]TQL50470.1 D-methionine transport system ATP-binding protein [Ornithinicoccus hortensis]
MITVSHVSKTFPATRRNEAVHAVDDVSLHVERGQVMGIVGPSGSGKSTLARCLNLLERPDQGSVVIDNQELTTLEGAQLNRARRRIGMIFQQFNLLDSRTALGNVELPLELAGTGRAERRARATALLERVGLGDKLHHHPAQLSGGQRQRVAIARALAPSPSVLLCDEATSALDSVSTDSVLALIRELTEELGLTTVLITHEMDVVKKVCDAVILLEGGRVVDRGLISEVLSRPDSPLATRLLPPLSPVDDPDLVDLTVGGPGSDAIVADLVREFGVGVAVVGGSVEDLGGVRFGRLRLRLDGDPALVAAARAWVAEERTREDLTTEGVAR